jgi:hypothetical protein
MKWYYDDHCDVSIGRYKNVEIEWRCDEWGDNDLYEAQYKGDTHVTTTLENMKRWIDKVVDGVKWKVNLDEVEVDDKTTSNHTQRLFLLILDEDMGDYFLNGVFDDSEQSMLTIEKIVSNISAYKIIRGYIMEEGGTIIKDYTEYDGRS